MTPPDSLSDLLERLAKRAKDDRQCAANNIIIAEALAGQMALFEKRTGKHNVYAVRMAVDHKSAARTDAQYASDLEEAIDLIQSLIAKGEAK